MRTWEVALIGLLMVGGCRHPSATPNATVSPAVTATLPRYASNIVAAPAARDASTTVFTTADAFDAVVAFYDAQLSGWHRMAMPAQTYQQVGSVVRPTANPNGNKGLVRWTVLETSESVTVTDRDGTTEVMEYRPPAQTQPARRVPAGQQESEMRR